MASSEHLHATPIVGTAIADATTTRRVLGDVFFRKAVELRFKALIGPGGCIVPASHSERVGRRNLLTIKISRSCVSLWETYGVLEKVSFVRSLLGGERPRKPAKAQRRGGDGKP